MLPNVLTQATIDRFVLPIGIQGLDSELGLRRISGKIARYETILRKYISSQTTVIDELRSAVTQQDFELARRLAHTTKGVSGNIGTTDVQTIAVKTEEGLAPNVDSVSIFDKLLVLHRLWRPYLKALSPVCHETLKQ